MRTAARRGAAIRLYDRYRHRLRSAGVGGLPRVVDGSVEQPSRFVRRLRDRTGGAVWPVADANTAIAGCEYLDILRRGGQPCPGTILPGSPRVVPFIETARAIAQDAVRSGARAIVAIGSGTLTDLAKYAATVAGLELACVPTAASVDAYNSARSALRIAGYHRTPASTPPSTIVVDPAIIRSAPVALTLSGFGDLAGKLLARLDWELASIVTGEPFAARECRWSALAARRALARLSRDGPEDAAMTALDALLVTGEAMRVAGGSRPAASSEHTLAHLWEVAVPFAPSDLDYHGLLVAAAMRVVVPCYRGIFGRLRRAGIDLHAPWPEEEERRMPQDIPEDMERFRDKIMEESRGRSLSDAAIAARRRAASEHLEYLLALADESLDAAERGLDALERSGIDAVLPPVPGHWVLRGLQWVRYLRNRYSAFDLAWEQGWGVPEFCRSPA